ncbi:hypothetical protein [Flavobacterium sp.]|uniref:hypothetical protein n=1 Tax=Flavobacterium sp. TaxID=239 RepID=UPI0028BF36C4|nr:hypothetical protein [Flavobacterium sp.]
MKQVFRFFAVILALSTFFASCSSDESNPNQVLDASITATVDGQSWSSMPGGATSVLSGFGMFGENQTIFNITGFKMDMTTLNMMIPASDLNEGTFNYDENSTANLSFSNEVNSFSSSEPGGSFSLTITSLNLDTGTISGTFSGTLIDFEGNSISVTNGEINNVQIMTTNYYSNGTMSLSRNGGASFTMDSNADDSKLITIMENSETNQVMVNGNNGTLTSDAGLYVIAFPKNVTPGTYNLATDTGFTAGLGNSDSEPEYNLTSGSITITSHSGNTVSGTFSYTVNNGVQTVNITNGSFSITHN